MKKRTIKTALKKIAATVLAALPLQSWREIAYRQQQWQKQMKFFRDMSGVYIQ